MNDWLRRGNDRHLNEMIGVLISVGGWEGRYRTRLNGTVLRLVDFILKLTTELIIQVEGVGHIGPIRLM